MPRKPQTFTAGSFMDEMREVLVEKWDRRIRIQVPEGAFCHQGGDAKWSDFYNESMWSIGKSDKPWFVLSSVEDPDDRGLIPIHFYQGNPRSRWACMHHTIWVPADTQVRWRRA